MLLPQAQFPNKQRNNNFHPDTFASSRFVIWISRKITTNSNIKQGIKWRISKCNPLVNISYIRAFDSLGVVVIDPPFNGLVFLINWLPIDLQGKLVKFRAVEGFKAVPVTLAFVIAVFSPVESCEVFVFSASDFHDASTC